MGGKWNLVERLAHGTSTLSGRRRTPATDDGRPSGELDPLDQLEKADRTVLAKRAERHGPVFMGLIRGEPTVCIVGLARCRRFLKDHADALDVGTLDLTMLFPGGFMRGMRAGVHLDYRRSLVRAIREADHDVTIDDFCSLAAHEMRDYAERSDEHGHRPEAWSATLSTIATTLLVRTFFGATHGTELQRTLVAGFRDLGPYGLVWNPQERQRNAFNGLRDQLLAELERFREGRSEMTPTCLLAVLDGNGELDDTMLGNLIYMVEMGRSDIQNFLRWLSRYAASDPEMCDAIANGSRAPAIRSIEEALLLEVLRTHQSERLERRTTDDIEFDGFRIPLGTPVRLCMWESHHDPKEFPEPHEFDHRRFLQTTPPNDVYAPFGLDHHQCPFGALTSSLGSAFVRALCAYELTLVADGPPVRGPYHWEPSRQLAVQLEPR